MQLPAIVRSRPVVIAVLAWVVVTLVSTTSAWNLLELRGFDAWERLTARPPVDSGITIVGIDESSFAELQQQWPWPRGVHAHVLDALHRAGAAVVAFDVVFAEPSDPDQDAALTEAITHDGPIILAGDLATQESAYADQIIQVEPLIDFRNAGAHEGLAAVNLDGDMVLRHVPQDPGAFWRAVLREDPRPDHKAAAERTVDPDTFFRYVGPDHTFHYISYY